MNDPFSNLNFGKSMGHIFFQKPILTQILQKNLKIGANFRVLVNVWVHGAICILHPSKSLQSTLFKYFNPRYTIIASFWGLSDYTAKLWMRKISKTNSYNKSLNFAFFLKILHDSFIWWWNRVKDISFKCFKWFKEDVNIWQKLHNIFNLTPH